MELIKVYRSVISCPKCHEPSDRLHRYNSGDQWMCPSCYVGMYCHPTPQTQWASTATDNVLNDVCCISDSPEAKAFFLKMDEQFKRIMYRDAKNDPPYPWERKSVDDLVSPSQPNRPH